MFVSEEYIFRKGGRGAIALCWAFKSQKVFERKFMNEKLQLWDFFEPRIFLNMTRS